MAGKARAPMATVRPALEADAAPVEAGGWLVELGGDPLFEAEPLAVGAAVVVVLDPDEVLAAEVVVMLPLDEPEGGVELETEAELEADWLVAVVLGGANGTVGGME